MIGSSVYKNKVLVIFNKKLFNIHAHLLKQFKWYRNKYDHLLNVKSQNIINCRCIHFFKNDYNSNGFDGYFLCPPGHSSQFISHHPALIVVIIPMNFPKSLQQYRNAFAKHTVHYLDTRSTFIYQAKSSVCDTPVIKNHVGYT